MIKHDIGDLFEALEDVKLSAWTEFFVQKGQQLQIAGIDISVNHDKRKKIEYHLCFPDKAPFYRFHCSEKVIGQLFKKLGTSEIAYCNEWTGITQ